MPKTSNLLPDGKIDPNGGFLCVWMYWRPKLHDPDPDMPGEKQSLLTYLPVKPNAPCLCGSGKRYRDCCRRQRYWHPICPNPDGQSYSLLAPQAVTFKHAVLNHVRERLMEDVRLHCVVDDPESTFWVFWGEQAIEAEYGIRCFGDIELKHDRTLLVTALSELRMQILLALLREHLGERFGSPQIQYHPINGVDKQTGAQIEILPPPRATRFHRGSSLT